MYTRVTV